MGPGSGTLKDGRMSFLPYMQRSLFNRFTLKPWTKPDGRDRFARVLARRIAGGDYTREGAAAIIQTKRVTLSKWLTRGGRPPAIPDPATIARIAWLWPGTDDPARYETVVRRLCVVASGRGRHKKVPSPAGLLVLRRLAENHMSMIAICPEFVQYRELRGLVWDGRATRGTVLRVAGALELPHEDVQELERRCSIEDKRTLSETQDRRLATRKRREILATGRKEGYAKRSSEAKMKVHSAYWAFVDEGVRPTRYQVAKRSGCDQHTADKYWPS